MLAAAEAVKRGLAVLKIHGEIPVPCRELNSVYLCEVRFNRSPPSQGVPNPAPHPKARGGPYFIS